MQILFIDESGTIPPFNKVGKAEYFALGGIVIPEDIWHILDKDLARLKIVYRISGEIKWRYFAQQKPGNKTNPLSHLSALEKEGLRTTIYQLISKFKSIRLISAIVNIPAAYALDYVNSTKDLYWYAYKQITERFQYYLQDLSRTVGSNINGIIICDNRQPDEDTHLQMLHQKLMTGSKTHFSSYPNLIEGVFIAPSHFSVGIQFADMVGGAVFRKFARNDTRYFDQMAGSFRKGPAGKIEGYGLVKWPK